MTDIFSALATRQSPQQAYFQRMLAEGTNTSPIQSGWQGASRLAHALLAGMELRGQKDEEKAAQALRMNLPGLEMPTGSAAPVASAAPASPIANALAGQPPMALGADGQPALASDGGIMPAPRQLGNDIYSKAIAANESGGRYDALGPVIPKSGDRAYGKYQVMGANIPQWTEETLGQRLTPQQFLTSKDAQEAVFNSKFGNYTQKYGPEGAARAWFAGEGGMNDPNRKDPLGTTVAQYGQKFNAGVAQQQPQQTAENDPAALPPNARPTSFMIPGQPQGQGAAIPARSPVQIDPQMAQKIREMIGSKDPAIQQQGFDLYKQFAKPREETRPLTDPRERAAKGIQPTDTNPYQVDAKGEVKPINPQPFAVNVNQQQESEYKKEAGGLTAKRHNEYVKQAGESREISADIGALRDIGSRIPGGTGKTAEITAALGPYAEALGIKIDGLGDMQAYNAIVSKMQPRMRVAGSGATSDYEMGTFLKAIPSLGKTPEGNKIIEDVTDSLHQHRLVVGEIAGQALDGTISPSEADKKIRALPDPMKLWKDAKGKLPSAGADTPAPQGGVIRWERGPDGKPRPVQ